MRTLNPKHIEAVLNIINQAPFFRHLSMCVKEIGMGCSRVELEIGKEHLNPFGGLHGGVYSSIIDTAAYWAVYCEVDEGAGLISIDLNVDFLAAAKAGKIVIKGKRIKVGKSMCLSEAAAFDENDKCLTHGTSKMMVAPGIQTMQHAFEFVDVTHLPPKFI